MKDNLIQFPLNQCSISDDLDGTIECVDGVPEKKLNALRSAFDEARKQWPIEMAELPEQNRKYVNSNKR